MCLIVSLTLSNFREQIVTVGKSVPVSSREEALTKFARAVFNRLFDMARGKEDNPAGVPLLRVEVSIEAGECFEGGGIEMSPTS